MCQTHFTASIIKHRLFPSLSWEHYISWRQYRKKAWLDGNGKCRSGFNSSRTCFVEKWENPESVRTHEKGWETRGFAGEKLKLTSPHVNYGLDNISVVFNFARLHFGCLHNNLRSWGSYMSWLYKSRVINKGRHPCHSAGLLQEQNWEPLH